MYVCMYQCVCIYVCIQCCLVLRTIDYTFYITLFLCTLELDSKLHYVRDGLIKETRREKFNIDQLCHCSLFLSLFFSGIASFRSMCIFVIVRLRLSTHVHLHHRDRDSTILNIIYNL